MMQATLDDLISMALFAQVVELRSFTAVAKRMDMSKSVVSARISRLEERLSVRLLHRTTRKVTLTEEGMRFYEHCARLVQAAEDAQVEVAGSAQEVRGVLRVSAPVTFSQMHLVGAVSGFMELNPNVEVHLHSDDRFVDLYEGEFDLALRFAQRLDGALVARRLATDWLVVVGSPAYLERQGTPQHPDELVDHDCLRYAFTASKIEWSFQGPDGPYAVPINARFMSNDGAVLRQMALLGRGLAVLPSYLVASDLAAGWLMKVLEPFGHPELGVYAVYPHRKISRRLRAFVDYLATWFAASASWTAGACPLPTPEPPAPSL